MNVIDDSNIGDTAKVMTLNETGYCPRKYFVFKSDRTFLYKFFSASLSNGLI